ncbi:MAG: redoxin domain-containing protein [Candidatus Eremiobacteraeota bacterium]|nr:redoxin domain-containing protein [Candidatus Eremiobacteraeota bacterium]
MHLILAAALAANSIFVPLLRASDWIGPAPHGRDLAGKVVLIDVFTFDCINCKHVVPELRRLRAAIPPAELTIIGIHSPETPYERVRANVVQNLAAQGITWPVVLDNSFGLWRTYGIQYWPTQLLFDRHGKLRKTFIGEGQDELVATSVRELVAER